MFFLRNKYERKKKLIRKYQQNLDVLNENTGKLCLKFFPETGQQTAKK